MFFVQMSGFPGSGKSTLALEIANRTGCIIVEHDVTKTALLQSVVECEIEENATGKIAYNTDFALVDFYLAQGRSVILDSPCLYSEIIERGTAISRKYEAKYKYIECYLDDFFEINCRLTSRQKRLSQISEVKSVEVFHNALKHCKKPLNNDFLTVNSKEPLNSYINQVMEYIHK
ncbi:AAA family ATPase [Solibacillus daqui]|uniref:AAA family ATPase n=1 Tax=Solibacillus daqui TaxID=2912187 RepID=UPI002366B4FD|nr:AAA family ATPase [Solibacillus daqui]